VPVSRVSLGPWDMVAGFADGPPGGPAFDPAGGAVVLEAPDGFVEVELVAAEAMPAAPKLAPATRAPVTRVLRMMDLFGAMVENPLVGVLRGHPGCSP